MLGTAIANSPIGLSGNCLHRMRKRTGRTRPDASDERAATLDRLRGQTLRGSRGRSWDLGVTQQAGTRRPAANPDPMRVLRSIASGLLAVLRPFGGIILFLLVLLALPVFVAAVLAEKMIFRPTREQELRGRLRTIESER